MTRKISYERVHSATKTVTFESAPSSAFVDRQSAAGFLRDRRGRILVVATYNRGLFEVPGGLIDPGEDDRTTVAREFEEEVGLVVKAGEFVTSGVSYFSWDDSRPYRCFRRYYEVERLGGRLKSNGDGHDTLGAQWLRPDQLNAGNTLDFILKVLPAYRRFLRRRP
ncbi:NUDIX hydrolase [Candidatus Uhrbacteria bacterium]|nr:NUDIX hydrolase [Candidatus Uhrbacteria bacterium]